MASFWHPLSTLLLTDPPCLATPGLLRILLGADGTVEMLYAGDRMWPAVAHGARVVVAPPNRDDLRPGDVVVACPGGIPDLLRVASMDGTELRLTADADPQLLETAQWDDVLGVARLPRRQTGPFNARLRRFALDLREAWTAAPDAADDPALTVRDKYDDQAEAYAGSGSAELEPGLDEMIRRNIVAGARILVIGSGSGRECFALARNGFGVTGLDFAPAMIESSTAEALRLDLPVDFLLGDVRGEDLGQTPYDAILFTYDVYSFLPSRDDRIAALIRMRSILAAEGRLFLSARRLQSVYGRLILGLQWVAGRGHGEWGDSHTRWINGAGDLRRSFVRVFSPHGLAAEVDAGGFELTDWRRGHGVLIPRL
jgi:SAM-dependent methyltransferase